MKREELVEIKKDKTGTGLLIEHDGYIKANTELIKEGVNGEWHCPYPFIVDAVFQKADVKNANGRIYPRNILEREIERYQEKIREHRALGECYTPDVLVLCEDGWKCISSITEDDSVLTLNTTTNEIEIQKITKKIEYDYDGDMIRLESRNISDFVTPNHGYPVFNRNGSFSDFYTAENIFNDEIKDMAHSFIPKNGIWTNQGDNYFILKGLKETELTPKMLKCHPDCLNDKLIPMSTFMKFLGIYLSEGDYRKNTNDVNIYQVKENVCDLIREMIVELDLHFTEMIDSIGRHTFRINDPRLKKYVQQFGDCYTKFVPFEIKQQSKENLRIFYDWFVLGDGRIRGDKKDNIRNLTDDVFSVSKQLVLDLNEIQLKIGYSGNFHIEDRQFDRYIGDRLIEGKNCHDMYFTLRSLTKGIYLDKRFLNVTKENYCGKVMCIEVPNHTFYVMSNGKCHWSKNCNHPSDSTIDLGRISHNIIELHWEGNTVVGKLELNISEGFRRNGICSTFGDTIANLLLNGYKIGVSSRAVGSVEQKLGVLMVGDDLELICWDVVSDPSTPGAWMGQKEELQQYVETKANKNSIINEKINKIRNVLNS